ncbi:phage DNA encapsidation protein [Enterococcus faecalis]|nr:phage DNA encapsidation protein [Enterococcus faecalis]
MGSEAIELKENPYQTEEGWVNVKLIKEETKVVAYISGARNIGKTYGFLKEAVENSLNAFLKENPIISSDDILELPKVSTSKWQFLFLRRYQTQSGEAKSKELIKEKFYEEFGNNLDKHRILKDYRLYVDYVGSKESIQEIHLVMENKKNKKKKRRIMMGYIGAISMVEKFRQSGYENVQEIYFDEFQAKRTWDYYKDDATGKTEPYFLMDIYESVTRERAGQVKLFCFGNSDSILNPHFPYYGYDEFDQVKTEKRNGTVVFFHLKNIAPNKAKGSAFHDLIAGTAYGDYSINNAYGDEETFNVIRLREAKKPRKCKYNIRLGADKFGVWSDGENHTILSRLLEPEKRTFVDGIPKGKEVLDISTFELLASLIKNRYLFFDTPDIRLIAEKHLIKYIFKGVKDEWKTFS